MLFFNSSKTLLCLKSSTLEVYRTKPYFYSKVAFPQSVVSHLELKNADSLVSLVQNFITSLGLPKTKVKLLLAESVVYQKVFPTVQFQQNPNLANDFLSLLPFDPKKLSQLAVTIHDQTHFMVANRDYYLTVVQGIEKAGWEVDSLALSSLFGQFPEDHKITEDEVKKLNQGAWWRQANFLEAKGVQMSELTPVQPVPTQPVEAQTAPPTQPVQPPNKMKRFLLGTLLVLFILAMSTFSLMNFGIIKNPFNPVEPTPTPEAMPSPSTTVTDNSALPQEASSSSEAANASASANVDKTKITITVINSSGVTGQAAQLTEALKAKGYTQVTPTSGLETKTKTTIKTSPKVNPVVKEEIAKVLITAGLNPVAEEDTTFDETEIVIETGKEASVSATPSATVTP